jgi:hypothetical protein
MNDDTENINPENSKPNKKSKAEQALFYKQIKREHPLPDLPITREYEIMKKYRMGEKKKRLVAFMIHQPELSNEELAILCGLKCVETVRNYKSKPDVKGAYYELLNELLCVEQFNDIRRLANKKAKEVLERDGLGAGDHNVISVWKQVTKKPAEQIDITNTNIDLEALPDEYLDRIEKGEPALTVWKDWLKQKNK